MASQGDLKRMTQWKSKHKILDNASALDEESDRLGLFAYPVLQAADILLYRATYVPVGHDQLQHLEFARDSARDFNARYGKFFPEPEAIICKKS
ncbi:MAG: hypothetical protein LQ351_002353 [Letrouitia transgressa]|nr:MAG: hypothetical protein LQ351_002353 [Letrouitia transgressa]